MCNLDDIYLLYSKLKHNLKFFGSEHYHLIIQTSWMQPFFRATAHCISDTIVDDKVYEDETSIKHTWQQGIAFPLFYRQNYTYIIYESMLYIKIVANCKLHNTLIA